MATKQTSRGPTKPKVPVTAPEEDQKKDKEDATKGGKDVKKESLTIKDDKDAKKADSRRKDKDKDKDRKEKGDDKEVCRDFARGRCDRGAFCRFYHPEEEVPASNGNKASSADDGNGRAVCRDFMRNMCRRGADCRFYHPPDSKDETVSASKGPQRPSWLTFCHDFQNGHCSRMDCRYFHITRGDEEIFRTTGDIVPQVLDQAVHKALYLDVVITGNRPACKEFLKGVCTMPNCRYRHLTQREYEEEVYRALQEEFEAVLGPPERRPCHSPGGGGGGSSSSRPMFGNYHQDGPGGFVDHPEQLPQDDLRRQLISEYEPEPKRQRYIFEDTGFMPPRDEFGDVGGPQRMVDDRLDYDRERMMMDYPPVNAMDEERLMQEIHNLRSDNVDMRRNLEQRVSDLRDELGQVMRENEGMRHDVTRLRLAASDSEAAHKAGLEKLTIANDNLLEDSRKLQETIRRLEIENSELRKNLDIKQKAGNVELEQKQKRIDILEKDIMQGRDSIMKVNNLLNKAQEENGRLQSEMEMLKKKLHSFPVAAAPDEQMGMKPREPYSRDQVRNDWRRGTGEQDNVNTNFRGQDRFGQFNQQYSNRNEGYGGSRNQDGGGGAGGGVNQHTQRHWQDNDRSRGGGGGNYSADNQYGRQNTGSRFEGRDYGLSGYENNQRGGGGGGSSSSWQQGGDRMTEGGGGQLWERRGGVRY